MTLTIRIHQLETLKKEKNITLTLLRKTQNKISGATAKVHLPRFTDVRLKEYFDLIVKTAFSSINLKIKIEQTPTKQFISPDKAKFQILIRNVKLEM